MRRNILVAVLLIGLMVGGANAGMTAPAISGDAAMALETFSRDYPNTSVANVTASPIPGLYEVLLKNDAIFYYDPATGNIIIGYMWSKSGKEITAARTTEITDKRIKDIPLSSAIKIGQGKNSVVEVTDPDCPFCRRADAFLNSRDDVTRYIFLYPLKRLHPNAEAKSKYILCQKDPAGAFLNVMAGKMDGKKVEACEDGEVEKRMQVFNDVAQKLRVQGTPLLIVNGHSVNGANISQIEKYLAENQ